VESAHIKIHHNNGVHKRIHRLSQKIIGSTFSAPFIGTHGNFIPSDNRRLPELTLSRYTHCNVPCQAFELCPEVQTGVVNIQLWNCKLGSHTGQV
jgi:hypothetical protein